jgi:hypothetical protein
MLTRQPGREFIETQRRADSVDLVRDDLLALSATPHDDAEVGLAGYHRPPDGGAEPRVIDALF